MANFDDLIAKYLLTAMLERKGRVFPEREVPMLDAQAADFYFEPGPGPPLPGEVFSLLNQMTEGPCTLEFSSRTPGATEIYRGPLRRHLELYQHRCLDAERRGEREPAVQAQWVLTPGRPQQVFEELGCEPAEDGFYRFTRGLKIWFVVLSELPRDRRTLALRLLGPLAIRQQALLEVRQIPENDPEGPELAAVLSYVRCMIEKDPRIPRQEKEDFMEAIRQEFERFKQNLIKEGRKEGLKEGLKEGIEKGQARTILKVLKARGIEVSEILQQRILDCTDEALLDRWTDRAAVAARAEDVIAP